MNYSFSLKAFSCCLKMEFIIICYSYLFIVNWIAIWMQYFYNKDFNLNEINKIPIATQSIENNKSIHFKKITTHIITMLNSYYLICVHTAHWVGWRRKGKICRKKNVYCVRTLNNEHKITWNSNDQFYRNIVVGCKLR